MVTTSEVRPSTAPADFVVLARAGGETAEGPTEKLVFLPSRDEQSPALHAFADARFWVDIMMEHALFFTMLMPEETAPEERRQAQQFQERFADLLARIESGGPPQQGELGTFTSLVTEEVKPFIDYKARLGQAQTEGSLRSLVWPLFFDHTRHEAERLTRRMEMYAGGASEFERSEVVPFWTNIMDEHARFVAHLLDPDEVELIDTCYKTSDVFRELGSGGLGGATSAFFTQPGTVASSLASNPETDAVLSAAETILDFKTKAARDIEAARIKSIIDPRLADHVRREAIKFIDELKRAA